MDGRIEIHDDVLMQQTLVKQKELDVKNAVQSQGSMTRTINRTVTGKFNKNINATQLDDDFERSQLPQQKILQRPQIQLKEPPKVLSKDDKLGDL